MNKEICEGIVAGLEEVKRFLQGEDTGGTLYTEEDIKKLKDKRTLDISGDIKDLRKKYKLSQSKFADEFGLNVNTLKSLDRGAKITDTSTMTLLYIISKYPDIVKNAVKNNKKGLHN
jgi:DNA-binding transcriptional regulator YiaG